MIEGPEEDMEMKKIIKYCIIAFAMLFLLFAFRLILQLNILLLVSKYTIVIVLVNAIW